VLALHPALTAPGAGLGPAAFQFFKDLFHRPLAKLRNWAP